MSEADSDGGSGFPVFGLDDLEPGDIGVTNEGGKVVFFFAQPVTGMRFDPENAQQLAANIASHAYEARFGRPPPDTPSAMLAQYVKAKAVDDVRPILITRVTLVVRSLLEQGRDPANIAMHAVDAVLKEVT